MAQWKDLPSELHTEILARVDKISRAKLATVMSAHPSIAKAAAQTPVFQNINLKPLTRYPLASLRPYTDLMTCCIAAGNIEAHYVRGIQLYFHKNNVAEGFPHLRYAAEGMYDEAIYLYGIIMLSTVEQEIGKTMLDMLGWKENTYRADKCWKRIKRSLHGVEVTQLPSYLETHATTGAQVTCHPNNFGIRCESCFYFKQITKFVYMI